jgi:hypothetical protein
VRYVVEFLIPTMVVIVAALVLFRNRTDAPARPSAPTPVNDDSATLSTGTFITILIIGAALTVALVYALHSSAS